MDEYLRNSLVRHIEKNIATLNFTDLSFHPQLNLTTLKKFKDKSWFWFKLDTHENFKWEWVQTFPDKPWSWRDLSKHKHFQWDWVKAFRDANWDWVYLTQKMTKEHVLEFRDKPLNWQALTLSSKMDVEFMIEHSHLPWTPYDLFWFAIEESEVRFIRIFRDLYDNHDWTDHTLHAEWRIIKKNMDLPWNKAAIKITEYEEGDIDIILGNPGEWNVQSLSIDIPVDVIMKHRDALNWDFSHVSLNKTLTCQHVKDTPDVNWDLNLVPVDPEVDRWIASSTIKRYWREVITNPQYFMCRKILLRNLNQIMSEICRNSVESL